ncbi:MAG: hypothetical protein A2X83_00675 [Desulfuromonadales bacterium GWD2_54_10]|nr:MAG: hypothetical protein A2X83_00675 [Desulfuromonadales bacterium GWD2_54_10]
MGNAQEIVRYKKERRGRIIEVVIWRLSEPVPGSPHPFKYRLFYGTADGRCIVRYDNERGKGDHRHVGEREEVYLFSTLRRLIEDFESDIERM